MGVEVMDSLTADPALGELTTGADSQVLSSLKPAWIAELANRWRKYHFNDVRLRFDTGVTINRKIGSPTVRQPQGHEVIQTLTIELGVDRSEISRMRHFAELAENFELFRAAHPDCTTWNRVKLLLAGNVVGEERTIVRALISRLRTATTDLHRKKLVLDEVDVEELFLELRKLGRELQLRAHIKLTVAHLPEEVTA